MRADEEGQVITDYIYLGNLPVARVDEWFEGMKAPQAPTGVTVIPGDKQLTVNWNADPEPVDGYKAYWGTEPRKYTNSMDVGMATSYTITGLTNGTPYYVAVTAYKNYEEIYYYHTDHLGTPIMMTDKDQNVVWEGEFLPFGEEYLITGTVTNNLRFPGQYYDEDTGLSQNINRTYNRNIGRYLEADPIGLSGGVNLYLYTNANPINLIDPVGLKGCCDATLPSTPVKEVTLTCFAEASNNCSDGSKEKRAITDCVYNRVSKNRSYWCGNNVIKVLACPGQFLGFGSPQYKKAENPNNLDEKECQKLKGCISAAQSSSSGTQYSYTNFNQTNKPGRTKICSHYFWEE